MVNIVVAKNSSVHLHFHGIAYFCWLLCVYYGSFFLLFCFTRLVVFSALFFSVPSASDLRTVSHFEVFRSRNQTGYGHTSQACILLPST